MSSSATNTSPSTAPGRILTLSYMDLVVHETRELAQESLYQKVQGARQATHLAAVELSCLYLSHSRSRVHCIVARLCPDVLHGEADEGVVAPKQRKALVQG